MTTLATTPTVTAQPPAARRARWRDLLGAEWIKFRSLRSNFAVLAGGILTALYVSYNGARQNYTAWPTFDDDFKRIFDLGHEAFYPPAYLLLMTTAAVVGAQSVVGEHTSGLIRTTLIAVPARGRVVAAKAAVVSVVLAVFGLIISVSCLAITLAVYGDRISAFSWSTPGVPRLIAAAVITFPVSGVIGMAIGSLIRNSAATVFALVVNFMIAPMALLAPDDKLLHTGDVLAQVSNSLPYSAWLQLTHLGSGRITGHHASTTESWISLPAWAVGSLVIAVTALRCRDV
ncbi:ABC transporter permease subunit [Streptomyces sp. BE133]|uniref:ABC transporter permease subunit n=1 Tax=Streptomyces sp. BE133 TaxID=3002523 RepID=UPI002E78E1BC|nr:ABC transporter permease subunit [Streptomyces sp. BE133]MEE1809663.1 ABC transporter permease subunit [Streptomyces sp. BE133]